MATVLGIVYDDCGIGSTGEKKRNEKKQKGHMEAQTVEDGAGYISFVRVCL